jgi:sugar lactone lactonase YvrE
MIRLKSALCILGMSWVLLATNHFPPLPARNSLHTVAGDVPRSARNGASQSVIFADDFERGTGNWYLNGDWEIEATNGNHLLHGVAFSFAQATCGGQDYRFEARVRVQSGETKLAVRVGDLSAGYYLGIEADGGLALAKWDGATWTGLGSDPGPYPAGQWHLLALEGEGSQLRGYVDGELKIAASDASYTSGGPMLNVPSGEADFDDVWMVGDGPQACAVVPPNGLNCPFGLALDHDGSMLVGSAGRISRVTPDGDVTAVAQATSPGEVVIDAVGTIYVVSEVDSTIYTVAPDGSLDPFVTSLANPWHLALGPDGYLYASDTCDTVRIDPDTGTVTLWLENLEGPMVFDDASNAYLRDGIIIYRVAPGGTPTEVARLPDNYPYRQYTGLARDADGNFYVGDSARCQNETTAPPWIPAETGEAVYRIAPDGTVSTFATGLGGVYDLTFGSDGYLYVTEHDLSGVARIAPDGTVTAVVPSSGLCTAHALAYHEDGTLYSMSLDNYLLMAYAPDGSMEAIGSGFNGASGDARVPALAFAGSGDLYTAEASHHGPSRITRITDSGATVVSTDVVGPSGLALDTTGTLYTTEGPLGRLTRINPNGTGTPIVTGLGKPQGLAYGPDGLFYVTELSAHRVTAWDAAGTLSATLPVSEPIDVTFVGGTLYVSAETGDVWRRDGSGPLEHFASGLGNAAGIAPHPEGGVAVAFGWENSIYRFAEEAAAPALALTAPEHVLADSGTTVTHTFKLHNEGNGRDGAWLAATSSHGWPVTVPGEGFVAPLPCGGERTLHVAVAVPAGIPSGIRDTLTLTATSRLDPVVVESDQVVTIVTFDIFLPFVLRGAG